MNLSLKEAKARYSSNGSVSLVPAELLAIVIGTNNALSLLDKYGSVKKIATCTESELEKVIGKDEAMLLESAFALGRLIYTKREFSSIVQSAADAADYMIPKIGNLTQEEMWVMSLDRSHKVVETRMIYRGSEFAQVVIPAEILRRPIVLGVSTFILFHNHPTGNVTPSPEDKISTGIIQKAAKAMGMEFLDHIIIGGDKYLSMKEENIF